MTLLRTLHSLVSSSSPTPALNDVARTADLLCVSYPPHLLLVVSGLPHCWTRRRGVAQAAQQPADKQRSVRGLSRVPACPGHAQESCSRAKARKMKPAVMAHGRWLPRSDSTAMQPNRRRWRHEWRAAGRQLDHRGPAGRGPRPTGGDRPLSARSGRRSAGAVAPRAGTVPRGVVLGLCRASTASTEGGTRRWRKGVMCLTPPGGVFVSLCFIH
jgi:hypothetical protein